MTAQIAADLRAAADVLRRDGWTQFRSHWDGAHCAVGAIEVVVDPDWQTANGWEPDQNIRFGDALRAWKVADGRELTSFNDAPGRTADEVIAALEAAADAAEAQS